jgi:amidase
MKRNNPSPTAIVLIIIAALSFSCRNSDKKSLKPPDTGSWLQELTIDTLQAGYRAGRYTVTQVVSAYLERINNIDKNGPCLNSIIVVNPDAMEIAKELDSYLAQGKKMGPLFGVPVIIKDNIDTHDKMATTAGATALRNSIAPADSWIAGALRRSGAVIIAKSNLSEWANFRAMVSSSGWSGIGGQTRNPYVLDRNPCGSSSGSGVAVSANLCMAAIGTETNGSIVCPANNNGIVGIKPTVGLLSRSGIIPISFSQDTPGPMCRNVKDAAIMLGALTGVDPEDEKTKLSEGKFLSDYTGYLKRDGLKGKRIGLVKELMGYSDQVDTLMLRAIAKMKAEGVIVVEVKAPDNSIYEKASMEVMLYEFKDGLNKYFKRQGENAVVKNVSELIAFNLKDTVELRYFDQKILIKANEKGDLESPEYKKALHDMLIATRENGIDKIMNDNRLDALVAPTGNPAWKTDLLNGDHFTGGSSSLAAISGYPAITVPMGFVGELPAGISFFGRAWSEPLLIEIAYGYEQATYWRKEPKFLLTD